MVTLVNFIRHGRFEVIGIMPFCKSWSQAPACLLPSFAPYLLRRLLQLHVSLIEITSCPPTSSCTSDSSDPLFSELLPICLLVLLSSKLHTLLLVSTCLRFTSISINLQVSPRFFGTISTSWSLLHLHRDEPTHHSSSTSSAFGSGGSTHLVQPLSFIQPTSGTTSGLPWCHALKGHQMSHRHNGFHILPFSEHHSTWCHSQLHWPSVSQSTSDWMIVFNSFAHPSWPQWVCCSTID